MQSFVIRGNRPLKYLPLKSGMKIDLPDTVTTEVEISLIDEAIGHSSGGMEDFREA